MHNAIQDRGPPRRSWARCSWRSAPPSAGRAASSSGCVIGLLFCGGLLLVHRQARDQASARAKPVTREEAPQLYAMVEDLTQRAGMPMPQLYVSPEQQPNAFATGRNPKHAAVCVTEGILEVLDRGRAQGRARPRAGAREAPRHPHRVGRRRGRDGDHVRRPACACGARCSAAATTTTTCGIVGAARDDDPRPDRRRR